MFTKYALSNVSLFDALLGEQGDFFILYLKTDTFHSYCSNKCIRRIFMLLYKSLSIYM